MLFRTCKNKPIIITGVDQIESFKLLLLKVGKLKVGKLKVRKLKVRKLKVGKLQDCQQ